MSENKRKYEVIMQRIEKEIVNKQFLENEKLPSERELTERFKVSRMTIRQVIDQLIVKGLLYRIDGRGAFVAPLNFQRDSKIRSFTQQMEARKFKVSSKILCLEEIKADEIVARKLGIKVNDLCHHLKRIRYGDDIAMVYETLYVPVAYIKDLKGFDLEHDSLYRVFSESYHQVLKLNKEEIRAVEVSGEIAQALYEQNTGVALEVEAVLYNNQQQAIEYGSSYYHHEHYTYSNVSTLI
ncbi:MAG: GntR family transcriptional regulator [Erysipelotrichaceae bacterium]